MDEFCSQTTIHGFIYLNSKNLIAKIFWYTTSVIVVICILSGTALLLNEYFRYDSYEIKIEYDDKKAIVVPDILFCNSEIQFLPLTKMIAKVKPKYEPFFEPLYPVFEQSSIENIIDFKMERLNDNIKAQRQHLNNTIETNEAFDEQFLKSVEDGIYKEFSQSNRSCNIQIRDTTKYDSLNCSKLFRLALTFNGICLAVTTNSSNHQVFEQYKHKTDIFPINANYLNLAIKLSGIKMYDFDLYLTNDKLLPLRDYLVYIVNIKGKALQTFMSSGAKFNFKMLNTEYESYSSTLKNSKCIDDKGQYFEDSKLNCHFDCLTKIIRKLLNCEFLISKTDQCKLTDIPYIDFIIYNYEEINNRFGFVQKLFG